ncbi:3-keto-disaccharide hydrolase [Ulvibacterium sp.]|uniref:3-keto-disaccharide hydrolase n=1 Tax=Ulvibacterium sp. TaxID=2665914 RepID=UPI003BACD49D
MRYILKYALSVLICVGVFTGTQGQKAKNNSKGWVSLFNGKNFDGWKVGKNASTFSVEDGAIKVAGPRAHLFYAGDVEGHHFKNFEFKASVMTKPSANSGIYIHTRFQEDGWPAHGYEVQVNNTQKDWRRTGSLYAIVDVKEKYVKDDVWYTEYVKVEGKRIIVKINDIVVVDYTEPENPNRGEGDKHRILNGGTFALQGHDPESIVYYKDIMVKVLP